MGPASSSPAMGCVGLPQPRSSRAVAAANARGLGLALRHDLDQRRDCFWRPLARKLPHLRDHLRPATWIPRLTLLERTPNHMVC